MHNTTRYTTLAAVLSLGMLGLSAPSAQAVLPGGGPLQPEVRCDRSATNPDGNGIYSVALPGLVWPGNDVPIEGEVRFSDGSVQKLSFPQGQDSIFGLELPGRTAVPQTVVITESDETTTEHPLTNFLGSCSAVQKAPSFTQTITCGADNDELTPADPSRFPITDRSEWENGVRRFLVSWDPDAPIQWFQDKQGQVGNRFWFQITDNGECPKTVQVPYTETVTENVPVVKEVQVPYTETVTENVPVTKQVQVPYTATVKVPRYVNVDPNKNSVLGTFQVDSYRPRTAAQVNTIRANSARNLLPYRYDGPNAARLAKDLRTPKTAYASLWGASKVEFVTVTVGDVAQHGSLRKAIDAKTRTVPNLGGTIGIGRTYTTAFKLAAGATPKAPWTSRPDTSTAKAQVEWDSISVPRLVVKPSKIVAGYTTKKVTKTRTETRTVTEPRTREVTKTRTETTTVMETRTREVTKYRTETDDKITVDAIALALQES